MLIGLVLASAIQLLTGYFTETNRRPVKDIAASSQTGAATVILSGIAYGMESAVYSALLIGAAVYGAFLLGTGNATLALFAVALAGTGLLTTVGVIVSMDSFGPVTDNAQGIAEMSGDVEGEGAQALTHLDAIGNTTKAITKGIAIATAVLAATALFGSFRTTVVQQLGKASGTFSLSIDHPNVLVGLIIGGSVVFLFASLLISAVGRAAQRVVIEVRNQFRTHPGIMDYTEKPDYSRVVDIVTADSLRELATPGILAVLTPIAVGFALGYGPLGSYLAGTITVGVLMAVFLANSGGAWDNAKKLVEDGNYGGKGSEAHAATIIGDTVGDPFKDTAGPAINPLIKVMNLVSLLIATSVVKYASNTGLRTGVAVGAVVIVVAAVVYSKRRSHGGLGDEEPASADSDGATVQAATRRSPEVRRVRRHRPRGLAGSRGRFGQRAGHQRLARLGVIGRPLRRIAGQQRGAPGRGPGAPRCDHVLFEPCSHRRTATHRRRVIHDKAGIRCRVDKMADHQARHNVPSIHYLAQARRHAAPCEVCGEISAVCLVGGGHRVAGDAEQVQDRIEVRDVERGVGGVLDHGLGVERDAEAGRGDHAEVVGAVADGDGLRQRDARRARRTCAAPRSSPPCR